MVVLSQNNKIAIAALTIFLVSFAAMLFFLGNNGVDGSANVIGSHGEEHTSEEVEDEHVTFAPFVEEMAAVKNSKIPVFITDNELVINFSRTDFCDFLSLRCDQVDGHKLFDLVSVDDVSDLASINLKLVQHGEKIEGIGPYELKTLDGSRLILLSATPVKDKEGHVFRTIFTVKDLTDKIDLLQMGEDGEADLSISKLIDRPNKG